MCSQTIGPLQIDKQGENLKRYNKKFHVKVLEPHKSQLIAFNVVTFLVHATHLRGKR